MKDTKKWFFGFLVTMVVAVAFVTTPMIAVAQDAADAKASKSAKKKKGKKAQEEAAPAPMTEEEIQAAAARENYDQAQAAYDKGDYVNAEVYFQKAYDIKPHPAVLKSIAECKLQQGQTPEAIALMEQLMADPTYTSKSKVKTRLDEAKKEVGHLVIDSYPQGASITLNGRRLDDLTPLSLYLTPGKQVIVLAMPGYADQLQEINLPKGTGQTVSVDFSTLPTADAGRKPELIDPFAEDEPAVQPEDGAAATEEPVDTTKEEPLESNGPPNAFWVAAAIAGVGAISGTVFGTMALRDEKDYEESGDSATRESGERSAVIADVSFGVAIGAAIAGTIILIVNKNKKDAIKADATAARWRIAPLAGTDSAGISTALSF